MTLRWKVTSTQNIALPDDLTTSLCLWGYVHLVYVSNGKLGKRVLWHLSSQIHTQWYHIVRLQSGDHLHYGNMQVLQMSNIFS